MYNLTTTCRFGGVETFVWEISRELARRGEEVHLFGGKGEVLQRIPGVRLRLFPFWARERVPDLGRRFRKLAERCSMGVSAFLPLARERFDILHIHKPFDLPLAWGVKKMNGSRVVLGSHGTDFFPGDRLFIGGVDASVSCSAYNSRLIAGRYGIRPEVIYNGIDPAVFRPLPGPDGRLQKELGLGGGDNVLIYAGRLVGLKGVKVLLRAAASLPSREGVKVLIVGEGEGRPELQALARRLGLGERAVFTGFVPHSELPRYYSLARAAVFPTLADEAFGISICEAMACGLPTVSTRVGGIPELVEGESGMLVPPGDPEALSRAVSRLLEDESLRRSMGEKAARRVRENFTWEKVADRLYGVYRRVLAPC